MSGQTSVAAMKPAALLLLLTSVCLPAHRLDRYALVLEGPPLASQAAERKDLQRLAVSDRRSRLAAQHGSVRSALAQRNIRVTGANQLLANVIFVEADKARAGELQSLPGVVYVERLRPLELHLNQGLQLMRVQNAWGAVNGEQNAGAGVKIGVLDTGIDIGHPAFRDDNYQYPAGFPKCQQSLGDCAYVNRKVIAARSYVNMLAGSASDPEFTRPDDLSPRDRVGHGTAVAMIAAGQRSEGPAATITGVAPRAYLGNYKVFGSPG
ncbi:MAG TPA: S8 family serine peptidase, partial [Bryobacteraceae bacterium]|nr:S8 family serine peptidase [Bryobacteraceae bacterium]